MSTEQKRTKIIRNEMNPFLKEKEADNISVIRTKKSWVKIGSGDNVLLDRETGEMTTTNIVAVKEVDDASFVKLFTQNIGLMLDLKIQGMKALSFLIWVVQKYAVRKDMVQLDVYTLEEFLEETGMKAFKKSTMSVGLTQLEDAKIIARAKKLGSYYLNPNFIFNGDRMRFVTEIRRKSANKQAEMEELGQQRLID